MAEQLTSTRPYLLRAMHEWLTDNNQTPFIVVDVSVAGVTVPQGYVKEGRIVLNIAWAATRNLQLDNDRISFEARFGGVAHIVTVPIEAVQGIYARDSGQGMVFQEDPPASPADESAEGLRSVSSEPQAPNNDNNSNDGGDKPEPPSKGPGLRLVK